MKVYQSNEIKNISILGSSGSGKTTLVEAMLYESGVIKRRGSIAAQNTVSDYFPVEKDYGYSVFSTVIQTEWLEKKLNFIDCPGSDDFIGGVVTSLSVTDTALILLNAQYGVEVGTNNHFRYTDRITSYNVCYTKLLRLLRHWPVRASSLTRYGHAITYR